jgi:hypothetical protein
VEVTLNLTLAEKVAAAAFLLLIFAIRQEGPYADEAVFILVVGGTLYAPFVGILEVGALLLSLKLTRPQGNYVILWALLSFAVLGGIATLIHIDTGFLFIPFVLVPSAAIIAGVPLWCAARAVRQALMRDWRGAIRYCTVLLLAVACWMAGPLASDLTIVHTIGPSLRAAVAAGKIDVRGSDILVSRTMPRLAAYNYSNWVAGAYVVYDPWDRTSIPASLRIRQFVGGRSCDTRVRAIGERYYLVDVNC